MMDMELETQLSVHSGTGLLFRHNDVVLFIPEPNNHVAEFVAIVRACSGTVDPTFDALADKVVALEFDVPPFACIGLGARLKIRVFGALEIVTDLASVPMLSGAGSTTWVEHGAALPSDESVTVSIASDQSDSAVASDLPATDLVEGLVPADGFALTVRRPARTAPEDSSVADDSTRATAESAPNVAVQSADSRVAAALSALGPAPSASQEQKESNVQADDIEAAQPSAMSRIGSSQLSDVFERDLADAEETDGADHTIVPTPELLETPPPPPLQHVPTAVAEQPKTEDLPPPPPPVGTTPPPPPGAPPPPPATAGVSVMARPCPSGHPNRPSRVTCSVCDTFLPSGQDALELMSRPPVGQIAFADGTRHILDKNLVVGRAPTPTDGVDCDLKLIRSDQISRRHLEIQVKDWDVFVVDCGSRNGTVLVPTDGAAPVKVEVNMPQLIEPGATLHFADQTMTLVAVGQTPVALNGNEVRDG